MHSVFHISLLKKCVGDPASIVPLESVVVKDSLSYEDLLVQILDRQVRRLRNKEVASVKVLWRSQSVEGATWEAEAAMKAKYPYLFLRIPLQLEVIVALQFYSLSCVNSILESSSISLYLHFQHNCMYLKLDSVRNSFHSV